MLQKPSIPKGTRDFIPQEMIRRNYIFDTIRKVFQTFGYLPIETPAMENLSTLMGKYGEEGDKLLFKILDSGEYWKKIPIEELINLRSETQKNISKWGEELNKKIKASSLEELNIVEVEFERFINEIKNEIKFGKTIDSIVGNENRSEADINKEIKDVFKIKYLSEKGLRYDLTVPFARFVVQHQNEITFPFKRYQIQPVWRADRPQKGRYREFYQCDVDVVGSNSLINEVELIQIVDNVFEKLNLDVTIKINNRKILSGIAEIIGEADKIIDITVAIDKLDKIGLEKVNEELVSKGINENAIKQLQPIINLSGTNSEKLAELKSVLAKSEIGIEGINDIEQVFNLADNLSIKSTVKLDLTLARGLNYYTGAIFEVVANEVKIGSICGGGRYDDLTGIFGLKNVSGVGISFGADRIYDVLLQLDKFPLQNLNNVKLMFANFGEKEATYCLKMLEKVREAGISAELYPDSVKMKKQFSYADNKSIQFVAIVGENEMFENKIALKNMTSGEQKKLTIEELIQVVLGE